MASKAVSDARSGSQNRPAVRIAFDSTVVLETPPSVWRLQWLE
ncbi:hypothetical protein [Halomontanus rarus]|nr:hypothetical protein [Halovivax sp. TS33]